MTLTGVRTGPREYRWRPDQPATLVWVEALDGGDLKNKVPFRDKVVALEAPFTAAPVEVAKTEWRFRSLSFTEKGIALLGESDRATRRVRTWILEPGAQPRKLWDVAKQDRYADPGTPVVRRDERTSVGGGRGGAAGGAIMQNGDYIYLAGEGASPEGDRPFLDRLNLKTLATERLFRSDSKSFETVVAPLTDDGMTRPDARRNADGHAELLHARARRSAVQAGGHGIQGSAGAVPRRRAAVHHLQAQGRREALRARCICRPATRRASGCR